MAAHCVTCERAMELLAKDPVLTKEAAIGRAMDEVDARRAELSTSMADHIAYAQKHGRMEVHYARGLLNEATATALRRQAEDAGLVVSDWTIGTGERQIILVTPERARSVRATA